ncbi:MAG: DUF1697 domain-containing protein [Sphingomonadaceae bacterium]
MTRYVAFFASMNVGGHRLKMADLRDLLVREEFDDVETVIASGNVLLSHEERPSDGLEEKLAYIVEEHFGFPTFAAVRTREELEQAISGNPFHGAGDDKRVHTHFLQVRPDPAQFDQLLADYSGRGDEKIAPGERVLYIDYVDGVANSKLTGPFIERRLGSRGTARNMSSLKRILEKMVQGHAAQ